MLSIPLVGFTEARAQNPNPVPIFKPPGFVTPPADVPCIDNSTNKLDLQCFIANDPDAARIRMEEAALFQEALTAANSGILDPFHQVETWANSRSSIPTCRLTTIWLAAIVMTQGGLCEWIVDFEHLYWGQQSGLGSHYGAGRVSK